MYQDNIMELKMFNFPHQIKRGETYGFWQREHNSQNASREVANLLYEKGYSTRHRITVTSYFEEYQSCDMA